MRVSSDRFMMIPGTGVGKDIQGLPVFYPMSGKKSTILGKRGAQAVCSNRSTKTYLLAIPVIRLRHSGFGKEAKSEREAAQRSFFQTVKV